MCHAYADKNSLITRLAEATVAHVVKEVASRHGSKSDGEGIPPIFGFREDGVTFCIELNLRVEQGLSNPLITVPLQRELEAMGFSDIYIQRKDGETRLMYSLQFEKELPVEVDARD